MQNSELSSKLKWINDHDTVTVVVGAALLAILGNAVASTFTLGRRCILECCVLRCSTLVKAITERFIYMTTTTTSSSSTMASFFLVFKYEMQNHRDAYRHKM